MIAVKYNTPIEVTEQQYSRIIVDYASLVAHRSEDGKFFISWWAGPNAKQWKAHLEKFLNN